MASVGVEGIRLDWAKAVGLDIAVSGDLRDGGASSFHFQGEDRISVAATIINTKHQDFAVIKHAPG